MKAIGVRFGYRDASLFRALCTLITEIAKEKGGSGLRDPDYWAAFLPAGVRDRFVWPSAEERKTWAITRFTIPVAERYPAGAFGSPWNFFRVIEAIDDGVYTILGCKSISPFVAEIRIDPWSYPYGGLGPFVALVEAYGCFVFGLNESGEYLRREDMLDCRAG
jgi:hypothetical protein